MTHEDKRAEADASTSAALSAQPSALPLGKETPYPERYDASLLFPIPRTPQRAALGIDGALPFHGVDIWNAYELSWLDARGKPNVAIAELRVPATTPNIVESKSLKLYLASFNQERIESAEALAARIARDLSAAARGDVSVAIVEPSRFGALTLAELDGESIDAQAIAFEAYGPPDADVLRVSDEIADEALRSNLLKSNCPVTGQPDWASIEIRYAGPRIDRESLLRYLVSFRQHADFHEHCVERIFVDVMRRCAPTRLAIHARYTRRGGIDINPWRSTEPGDPPNPRAARQ
jgi:7-cyano-7-deazaguanine reductase